MLSMDTWVLLLAVTTLTGVSVGFHVRTGRDLRRNSHEQVEQTRLLQLIYALQSKALRPGIEADRQRRIVDALIQSGLYSSREARDSLVAVCPAKLAAVLERNNIARIDLAAIIRGAARWDADCLRAVLDEAIDSLNGSYAGKELRHVRAELVADHLLSEGD